MNDQRKGLVIPLIIAIIAVLTIGCGVYIFQKTKTETPVFFDAVTQYTNKNTSEQEQRQETRSQEFVNYVSAPSTIKTILHPQYQAVIRVLNIGTIKKGQFRDKILAVALYEHNEPSSDRYGVLTYAYYISDNVGNPIAWDKNFLYFASLYTPGSEKMQELLGLSNNLQQDLSFLPKQFSHFKDIVTNENKSLFAVLNSTAHYGLLNYSDFLPSLILQIGLSEEGFKIIKITDANKSFTNRAFQVFSPASYFVVFPFGKMIQLSPKPDFMDTSFSNIPKISWTTGTTSIASYVSSGDSTFARDCYNDILGDQFKSNLIQSGITVYGDPIYEIDVQKYPKFYDCLYKMTGGYLYKMTGSEDYQYDGADQNAYKISYIDFIKLHPIFFWKHPYGDMMVFNRRDTGSDPTIVWDEERYDQ